tara:strand:- start:1564 stop:2790 length:1227 start_codon:yes stop_codon:yes gene_type:complete
MNFSEFITEQKNTHMTHIEDKVLYGGVKGTREAILALRSLRDTLGGEHAGSVSVKWDGAPAVFAGIDPRDGRFFVAKKGIFNKSPTVYKSDNDIDNDTSGDLNTKLKEALRYLPELGIKGIIQGDFLYSRSDLALSKIKGKKYVTFHPNTIVYAIPANTEMATRIKKSKIGIVWHTTYTGNSFETLKASYGVDVSKMNKSTNVWSQDAMLRDMTNYTMTKKDTEEVNGYLSKAGFLFNQISSTTLKTLESNEDLAQLIETYGNTFVRKGQVVQDTTRHANGLVVWIKKRYQSEISKRKTEQGKVAQKAKLNKILSFFSEKNKKSLIKMFELQKVIVLAKLKLINILNKLNRTETFLKTRKGYRLTGQEGYVAIDKLGGDAVKIVDRMEFSFANFSPTILKGWDKPGRN